VKYEIQCDNSGARARTFAEAKAICAELLLCASTGDASVYLRLSDDPGRPFRATLSTDDGGEPVVIFEAAWSPVIPAHEPGAINFIDKADCQFKEAELERARRVAIYARMADTRERKEKCGSPPRAVVRLDDAGNIVGEPFGSVGQAAQAAGVDNNSIRRRARKRQGWAYADEVSVKGFLPADPPAGVVDVVGA
jgi:hypothetical protein